MPQISGAYIEALSTTPAVIQSGPSNPVVTSVLNKIDSSDGGGITLPLCVDVWFTASGYEPSQAITIINNGPNAITVAPAASDAALPVSILPAYTSWNYSPGGAGTWSVTRNF